MQLLFKRISWARLHCHFFWLRGLRQQHYESLDMVFQRLLRLLLLAGTQAVSPGFVGRRQWMLWWNGRQHLMFSLTWPTEEELMEASNDEKTRLFKKKLLVPCGTFDYQAAWIVDDEYEEKGEAAEDEDEEEAMEGGVSLDEEAMEAESEDDDNDTDKEGSVISEQDNGRLGLSSRATSVWEGEDDDRSEIMEDDDDLTPAQRKEEIGRLKAAAHAADEEFPDEVDKPTDVPARQRFAKYRGLRSLHTSPWDPKVDVLSLLENQPLQAFLTSRN